MLCVALLQEGNKLRRYVLIRELIFVGAERELSRSIHEWNQHQIQKTMLQRNVDWQFNPLAGSHYGGVWEKII